jgi:DNA-binding transcriptional LysR family regulator
MPLLPNYKLLPERGIYAIYPDKRYLPLKVRKFIDYLAQQMSDFEIK